MKKFSSYIILVFIVLLLSACSDGNLDDIEVDEETYSTTDMLELAKEMNNYIYSDKSIEDLKSYFNLVREKISDKAFQRKFNVENISVANSFNHYFIIRNSEVSQHFIEKLPEAGLVNVVVISKIDYTYEEYTGAHENEPMERFVTNVYTFSTETGKIESLEQYW